MSKNMKAAQGTGEEEWEDVEEGEEEEEEDTTINNSDVVMKYKKAATWANEALQVVLKATKAGAKVVDLCKLGDETVADKVQSMFRGVEKGLAFPTSVSVNSCVCHNSPVPGEETTPQVLVNGDVVRIDLAVHIDGYSAQVAHTIQITESGELAADSKEANVINAAYAAINVAIRKMRPGVETYEVTEIIEKAAAHFNVTPVDGVLSHVVKRYIVDGFRCIPSKKTPEQLVHEYPIESAQVWALDIAFTTGKGKLKERDARPSIFKVTLDNTYTAKMESARELAREVDTRFQTFPFGVRNLETKKARLGLSEMVKHGMVSPYPVLFEKDGEVVAQFKVTLLITPKKIERITGLPMQKGPAPAPFTDEVLLAASKLPLSLEEKKTKK
ncbi:aminopeptidase, putative [Bodo saltans]|uniref:Aminopeptidase, putative n=1 Tax=Bodo saltans TaxID=75058 RepID=A0A0S4J160_BODSA|nr:aminopeptidase, putative [Bodo saltans]|eukprot:CUG02068.1 aminopeptidase, putative [Bodo saltans]